MHRITLKSILATLAGILLASLAGPVSAQESADLVLTGGQVLTMDDARPQAEAIACRDGKIVAVGDSQQIKTHIGPDTQVIRLDGLAVSPGFIEGHGHFAALGYSKMRLDLSEAKEWSDVVAQVREAAKHTPPGQWIMGRGWHQSKWRRPPAPNVEGYPTNQDLNKAAPRHPVVLDHASGHMCIANTLAMQLSGVTEATRSPPGGELLRDENGLLTGVFRETAQALLAEENKPPAVRADEFRRAMRLAAQECLRYGITSFQDAGSSFGTIDAIRELEAEGKLPVRLWVMVRESNSRLRTRMAQYRRVRPEGFLTVRAVKRSLDGALGPHGAWLLEPYADQPGSGGLQTLSLAALQQTMEIASELDCQVCVHAIGDRANREVLNAFEDFFESQSGNPSRRWRIEHAQHLHPDDIPRFAKLGVVASMQGIHCTSDAPFVIERLGEKRAKEGAYVWQSLLRSGAVVINGTDAPVEKVDPFASFYASVTRRSTGGAPFFPEQKMTRKQALRSYTIDAAYAAFEEQVKGSITPGKLADLVVLDQNLMTCDESSILNTRVVYTIVGGRIAYDGRKNGAASK